jgi:hypothetical protein
VHCNALSSLQEWHDFFAQYGEVASITVALDNGDMLRALAEERVHCLAMALSGQDDSGAPDAGGEVRASWIEDERDKNTKNLTTVMHSVAKGAGLLSSHLEARALARRKLVDTCSKTYDVSR